MARRKPVPPPTVDDGLPILPRHLVAKGLTAAEFSEQNREKRAWLKAHGIDPGDWSQVYPVLKASWRAHGVPSAADRARERFRQDVLRSQQTGGTA